MDQLNDLDPRTAVLFDFGVVLLSLYLSLDLVYHQMHCPSRSFNCSRYSNCNYAIRFNDTQYDELGIKKNTFGMTVIRFRGYWVGADKINNLQHSH